MHAGRMGAADYFAAPVEKGHLGELGGSRQVRTDIICF